MPAFIRVSQEWYYSGIVYRQILFPFSIRLFSLVMLPNYAIYVIATLCSAASAVVIYNMSKYFFEENLSKKIAIAYVVFPPHKFISSVMGQSEALFLLTASLSLYYFLKEKHVFSAIFAALCTLTRIQGALNFLVYFIVLYRRKELKHFLPYLLIPLAVLFQFSLYYVQTGDFFALFHNYNDLASRETKSGALAPFPFYNLVALYQQLPANIYHLFMAPFSYILYFFGLYRLYKRDNDILFWWTAIHLGFVTMISHWGIARFIVPAFPFIFGYKKELEKVNMKHLATLCLISVSVALPFFGINALKAKSGAFVPGYLYNIIRGILT